VLDNQIAGGEFDAHFLERIGNIFEKNQAKNDVLVFSRAMLLRSLSAASHNLASKPRLAEIFDWEFFGLTTRDITRVSQAEGEETRNCGVEVLWNFYLSRRIC
jgi:hypothetical protein